MEVPRLGAESELPHLPAYTTATATQDPSHVCDLHHCTRQGQIFNPLGCQGFNLHLHEYEVSTTEPRREGPLPLFFKIADLQLPKEGW